MGRPALRMSSTYFHLLLALSEGPKHGYAMMREIDQRTSGRVSLGPSSLYYSLSRLADAGLIAERDVAGETEDPHEDRRRYYDLTADGRARLASETAVLADVLAHARAMGFMGRAG